MRRVFPEPFVAAAVQWAPSFHDLDEGTDRAVAAIAAAADEHGARLVVFPEAWLPGYPYWEGAGDGPSPEYTRLFRDLHANALTVPGPHLDLIASAARQHGVTVVLGCDERDPLSQAIYNTMVYLGPDGSLLGRHRKMVATITEKLVWTHGDGSDLDAYDTAVGRIGGLICYEHQMAPARFACCDLGVQVHASVWPGHGFLNSAIDAATRHLATENACFVIVAREVMSPDRLPAGTPFADHPVLWSTDGGSAIIAPGGEYLAGPVFGTETIVAAEIDLERIMDAKWWVNAVGNYARPDIFQMVWNRQPKPPVIHRTAP